MSRASDTPYRHSLRYLHGILGFARSRWGSLRGVVGVVGNRPHVAPLPHDADQADAALDETIAQFDPTETISTSELWRDLSPAAKDEVRRQVLGQQLSPALVRWISAYQGFGPRDLYLWRWCALGARLTTLPCVDPAWREHVCDTKVLSIMLNVLVDDVADRREQSRLLAPLLAVVRGTQPQTAALTKQEQEHVEFTIRVRGEYWRRVERYSCAEVFHELLEYDLDQLFNAIHYSALLNQQLGLLNIVEHDLYSPHNMMMMSFATLDLMCSPDFHAQELGKLREAVWHAQWMGRIGNLLSTWEREIAVGDFTSGVFAQAISRGDLTIDELRADDRQHIAAVIQRGGYHAEYCHRWRYHRECFQQRATEIRSADMRPLLEGHDRFFRLHLGSRGLI